jgi:hypothetical protein
MKNSLSNQWFPNRTLTGVVQALTAYDLPYKASRDIRPVRYNIEKDHSE